MRFYSVWFATLLALPAVGCRATSAPRSDEVPFERPLPYVICIALPLSGDGSQTLPVDSRRLEAALHSAADAFHVCTRLNVLAAASGDLLQTVKEARRHDADLLLRIVQNEPATYRFSHRNAWFFPNTLLWFLAGFPSFWIEDRVYEIDWETSFKVYCVTADREVPGDVRFELHEEHSLSLSDQGWTAKALYTPPGFYEGPDTGRALVPAAEEWLVSRILAFLRRETRDPGFPSPVQITVHSPRNTARVASLRPMLRYTITSPTVLSRLRLELDGDVFQMADDLSEWDPLTMMTSQKSGDEHVYRHRLTLPAVSPGEHRLRILVLATSERGVSLEGTEPTWSATQTIRFTAVGGETKLALDP